MCCIVIYSMNLHTGYPPQWLEATAVSLCVANARKDFYFAIAFDPYMQAWSIETKNHYGC